MPTPPPPTNWDFALDQVAPGDDLIGVGADLEAGTLYAAYTLGVFPMGIGDHGAPPIGWWSPDPRGVLRLDELRVPRSLRKSMPRFEVRVDTAFDGVVAACADPGREGRWITPEVAQAYAALHDAGLGALGRGAGRRAARGRPLRRRHRRPLRRRVDVPHGARRVQGRRSSPCVDLLAADGDPRRLIDVQWRTDHLATLGVSEMSREDYLRRAPRGAQRPAAGAVGVTSTRYAVWSASSCAPT